MNMFNMFEINGTAKIHEAPTTRDVAKLLSDQYRPQTRGIGNLVYSSACVLLVSELD